MNSRLVGETRWTFFPRITLTGHLVAQLEELSHVHRVEAFGRLLREIRRDESQVKVISVSFAQRIYLVEIPYALCPDE